MNKKNLPPAFSPAPADTADRAALRALALGSATEAQQKRALDWIIRHAAQTYEFQYRPDGDGGDRDTAFGLGRAFVGQQIVKILNMSSAVNEALRKTERGTGNG